MSILVNAVDINGIENAISGDDVHGQTEDGEILNEFGHVPMNIDGDQTDARAQPPGPEDLMQDEPAGPDCDGGEQPTKCPPKRKNKRSPGAIAAQFKRRLEKQIVKAVVQAKENTVVFDTFYFETAVLERAHWHQAPAHWNVSKEDKREWLDHNEPRLATSAEGVPIVLHLPSIINDRGRAELYSAVMKFGSSVPLAMGAGTNENKRNTKASYRVIEGQLAGNVKLVTAWHAVGHSKESTVISRDIIRTATQFSLASELINDLEYLNILDPLQYNAMKKLRHDLRVRYPHVQAMDSIDGILWEGRSFQYNGQTPLHPDSTAPPRAWVALVALGEFTKGQLWIPRLNLLLFYGPGTIIFIRGHILPHEVLAFEDGQRVSITHFTHETLWKEMGMSLP
ncbi:hypothetical protein DFH29DRAFT_1067185 [Suillus ampliporus]|nr:hypothetical protein DFH29DRAFT_1067185 [Suillus ampliporus]